MSSPSMASPATVCQAEGGPGPGPARPKASLRGLTSLCPAREKPSLALYPCVQAAGPPVGLADIPVYLYKSLTTGTAE